MTVETIEVLQCSFCLSIHHGIGREERAAACCTCPVCKASPSKWCGMFKKCRACELRGHVADAEAAVKRAKENLHFYKKHLAEYTAGLTKGTAKVAP